MTDSISTYTITYCCDNNQSSVQEWKSKIIIFFDKKDNTYSYESYEHAIDLTDIKFLTEE